MYCHRKRKLTTKQQPNWKRKLKYVEFQFVCGTISYENILYSNGQATMNRRVESFIKDSDNDEENAGLYQMFLKFVNIM